MSGVVLFTAVAMGATGTAGAETTPQSPPRSAVAATDPTVTTGATTTAATDPVDITPPSSTPILKGFEDFWDPDGDSGDGQVLNPTVLEHNDEIVVWINNHATAAQQFSALQTAVFEVTSPGGYDQSITIAPAFGSVLAPLYVQGRQNGGLPLVSALISAGSKQSGNYIDVGTPKSFYKYRRPYWTTDAGTPYENDVCPSGFPPGDPLAAIRDGQPWADSQGDLLIDQIPPTTDSTGEFTASPTTTVSLNGGYSGLCTEYSFPSGHTTSAYQAAITLATLVPELGPELLARGSEHGNNRLVDGVHSPLDVIGGRMLAEASVAARWSQPDYVAQYLLPAQQELRTYLQTRCGGTIAACLAQGQPYQNDPYGGQAMPGGTAQIVTDRPSAVATYRERLDYAFAPSGTTGLPMTVPPGAENLLVTTFPTLTSTQRQAVLAQTSLDSGDPLDLTKGGEDAWQRLDLASAMSATVQLEADGSVTVISTGGAAQVVGVPPTTTPTTTTPSTTTPATSTPSTSTSSTNPSATTASSSTDVSPTSSSTDASTTTPTFPTFPVPTITIPPVTITAAVPVVVDRTTTYAAAPVVVADNTGNRLASTGASIGAPLAVGTVALGSGVLLLTALAVRRRPRRH